MFRAAILVVGSIILVGSASAFVGGDANRGAALLRRESCLKCHSIRGEGGTAAPDLGRATAHSYTPATFASIMWNHAPAMWSAMAAQGIERPKLTEQDGQDLFAYLYSIRYFDHPGEAERGKRVFTAKHCAGCHSLSDPAKGPGNPVTAWKSISDPVILVQQMWNHSSMMKRAMSEHRDEWVQLTSQDLADIVVYLQNLPGVRNKTPEFWLPDPINGVTLFHEKGCDGCHTGSLSLEKRLANQTLTDIAAAMWNHAPKMATNLILQPEEMRQIVAFVWGKQYLGPSGNASKGKLVFEKRRCATCHNDPQTNTSKMSRGEKVFSPLTMVGVVWQHGPQMLETMKSRNIEWPRLTPEEMSNVVAFLNTRP